MIMLIASIKDQHIIVKKFGAMHFIYCINRLRYYAYSDNEKNVLFLHFHGFAFKNRLLSKQYSCNCSKKY